MRDGKSCTKSVVKTRFSFKARVGNSYIDRPCRVLYIYAYRGSRRNAGRHRAATLFASRCIFLQARTHERSAASRAGSNDATRRNSRRAPRVIFRIDASTPNSKPEYVFVTRDRNTPPFYPFFFLSIVALFFDIFLSFRKQSIVRLCCHSRLAIPNLFPFDGLEFIYYEDSRLEIPNLFESIILSRRQFEIILLRGLLLVSWNLKFFLSFFCRILYTYFIKYF